MNSANVAAVGSRLTLKDRAVTERLRVHLLSLGLIAPDVSELVAAQLAGGFSHETWRVTAPALDVAIKFATGDGPLAHYDIEAEARVTARAGSAGVPTAVVLSSSNDPSIIGAPFMISEFVSGDVPSVGSIVKWLDSKQDSFRVECARSVVEILVRLAGARPSDTEPPRVDEHYGRHLDETVGALHDACSGVFDVPMSIEIAHRWFQTRLTDLAGETASMTHGDFRIGNLIFEGSTVAALIDWERAGWGHPLYDLGYLCLPGMRHGDRVGGLMSEQELRFLWADVTGSTLDIGRVAFFRCMSIFTELSNCVRALVNYSQGQGRTSLLRIVPLVVRLENDLLEAMERIEAGDAAL